MNEKTDQQLLKEEYDYLPETGLLLSKRTGKPVGQFYKSGYLVHHFKNKPCNVHRLIYCWYHGYFPEHHVDHINQCKVDNRIINLREVTPACNSKNVNLRINSVSAVCGVRKDRYSDKWSVRISHNNEHIFIGQFTHFINAVKARYYAEELFGYTRCNPVSTAAEYLMKNLNKEDIDEQDLPAVKTVSGEWDYFCLAKKEKIYEKALKLGVIKDT